MTTRPAVFLDTTIQIARRVREVPMRRKITDWLGNYSLRMSSNVVLQEFKRRVLRDVAYLAARLHKSGYSATLHHVTNVLPVQQHRKMRMCLLVLHNLLPGPPTDNELTERALRYCHTLLLHGETQFALELDRMLASIDCYWAKIPITEKKRYTTYDLGGRNCEASKGLCRVGESLKAKEVRCRQLGAFLESLPDERLSNELRAAREVLRRVIERDFQDVVGENPCTTVGDLLIALDSDGVPNMYTMNYRESQAYCDLLGQNLARRPNDPAAPDVEHLAAEKPWPIP